MRAGSSDVWCRSSLLMTRFYHVARPAGARGLLLGAHHEGARQRGHALASSRETQVIRGRRRHGDRTPGDLAHGRAGLGRGDRVDA